MPPPGNPVELVERVEPCAHVGLGESGHIGAHREDAISTARPRLLERLVVMLVEAGALIAEKYQLARPLSRIRKQLAHHLGRSLRASSR